MQGGGGRALPAKLGVEEIASPLSSRIYFGICPAIPVVRNVGQTLNQVQGDKNMQIDRKCPPSSRGANGRERRGDPVKNVAFSSGLPRSRWSLAMTPTESVLCLVNRLSVKKCAFTMAEILLSLTIIGVVAAITLPSLTGNINERTWNTQRKALYARFSQAIALMPSLNGYGTLQESTDSAGSTSIEDTAAETFVTSGLAKVLKINNICDNEHLEDCGVPSRITTLDASQISTPTKMSELNSKMTSVNIANWNESGAYLTYDTIDTKAAAFETTNGESILVFYNPSCQADMQETGRYYVQTKLCATFIYDLNGNKGPNTVNKDIGIISVIYPTDSVVVAPYPHAQNASTAVSYDDSAAACTAQDPEYRLPNKYELISMFSAQKLYGMSAENVAAGSDGYNTSSLAQIQSRTHAWRVNFAAGTMELHPKTNPYRLRCVKR